jgi:hypothetical protein
MSSIERIAGIRPPSGQAPEDESQLGFRPRLPMTSWYWPSELLGTVGRVLMARMFGSYADQREMQAALEHRRRFHDFSDGDDLWLDFIADIGDGWNSCYSMAWLLAQPELALPYAGETILTRRGQVLIMGGDEVYPTPSPNAYRDRLAGPYLAALPAPPSDDGMALFAIPGNHDWYDGLVSFLRLFSQLRWIGGRQTRQARSYFALRLPHGWWLWGIDIQLNEALDRPQLEYFTALASEHVQPGDRVILCTPEPSWVHRYIKKTSDYGILDFLERQVIQPQGAQLALTLTGDLHHYSRYVDAAGGQPKVTAGGGGAFMHETHNLPQRIMVPQGGTETPFEKVVSFPAAAESRRLMWRNLGFPFLNPHFCFGWVSLRPFNITIGLLGGAYVVLAALLISAGRQENLARRLQVSTGKAFIAIADALLHALWQAPALLLVLVFLAIATYRFCDLKKPWWRLFWGIGHGTAHFVLCLGLTGAFLWFNLHVLRLPMAPPTILDREAIALSVVFSSVFALEMQILGGIAAGLLFGLYLTVTNLWFHGHTDEASAALRIPDFKNFVRLHVQPDGCLTMYPVCVRRVCRQWRFRPGVQGAPWFAPEDENLQPRLIEPSVAIR